MQSHRPWSEFANNEKDRVRLILTTLREFSYGYERANEVATEGEPTGTAQQFYMNSLYQYSVNYFLSGGNRLELAVKELGSEDLLRPIQDLLQTPLGSTNFGKILKDYRNAMVVHQQFSFKPIQRIYNDFDMTQPENAQRFSEMAIDLFSKIQQLYFDLDRRYPQAFSEGAAGPPIPSITDEEGIVDWFVDNDEKLNDIRRFGPEVVKKTKAEIKDNLAEHNTFTSRIAFLQKITKFHEIALPAAAERFEAGGRLPGETDQEAAGVLFMTAIVAAKMRVIGYIVWRRYGVDPATYPDCNPRINNDV